MGLVPLSFVVYPLAALVFGHTTGYVSSYFAIVLFVFCRCVVVLFNCVLYSQGAVWCFGLFLLLQPILMCGECFGHDCWIRCHVRCIPSCWQVLQRATHWYDIRSCSAHKQHNRQAPRTHTHTHTPETTNRTVLGPRSLAAAAVFGSGVSACALCFISRAFSFLHRDGWPVCAGVAFQSFSRLQREREKLKNDVNAFVEQYGRLFSACVCLSRSTFSLLSVPVVFGDRLPAMFRCVCVCVCVCLCVCVCVRVWCTDKIFVCRCSEGRRSPSGQRCAIDQMACTVEFI